MNAILEKIKRSARLISLPTIYLRLRELLADADFAMVEVALLISQDPGMAARFLRVVNSAYYRRPAEIQTVSHAVSMLGAQQVHDIVLCASIAETFDDIPVDVMDMPKYWLNSVTCAATVRQLASGSLELESERMFLIGLLHDLGHLFMYLGIPDLTQQALARAKDEKRALYLVEREMFGFDYALLGGIMMKSWGLPKGLRVPIAHHPEPSKASQFRSEAAILHLASHLIQMEMQVEVPADSSFVEGTLAVDPMVWDVTGLTREDCLEAAQTAAKESAAIADSLFH